MRETCFSLWIWIIMHWLAMTRVSTRNYLKNNWRRVSHLVIIFFLYERKQRKYSLRSSFHNFSYSTIFRYLWFIVIFLKLQVASRLFKFHYQFHFQLSTESIRSKNKTENYCWRLDIYFLWKFAHGEIVVNFFIKKIRQVLVFTQV